MAALLLCMMIAVLSVAVRADFGDFSGSSDYDFSYDYDSDWSSGSSYGGGDYSSSSYGSSGGGSWDIQTIAIMAGIIIAAVVIGDRSKRDGKKGDTPAQRAERAESRANRAALTPIGEYVKFDPDFNAAALCEKAANLYVQMQNGWTAKDIEPLRPYFTDELFTQMERSLQGYVQRGETNVVERIAVLDVTPRGFCQTGGEDHILLRLRTRITDYTVKDGTQQVIRGSREKEKFMTYEWELLRPTGIKTAVDGGTKRVTCPACGAPLDVNASARCPYCSTVLQQQAQSWVISAIRGIRQESR